MQSITCTRTGGETGLQIGSGIPFGLTCSRYQAVPVSEVGCVICVSCIPVNVQFKLSVLFAHSISQTLRSMLVRMVSAAFRQPASRGDRMSTRLNSSH